MTQPPGDCQSLGWSVDQPASGHGTVRRRVVEAAYAWHRDARTRACWSVDLHGFKLSDEVVLGLVKPIAVVWSALDWPRS